jgi:protoheme IX farnesyltransferase
MRALVELGKPRITFMVLVTAAVGLALAPPALQPGVALSTLVGLGLVVASANALNMLLEADTDALMERTRRRPLPSGRLNRQAVLWFAVASGGLGLPVLAFGTNALTGFLGALSLVLYAFVYTPLKRRSTVALLVGAIPGAAPPLLGWTAATGRLDLAALGLFAVMFFWQVPHFIAISLFRTRDYQAAGIKIVPVEVGERRARERIVYYSLMLVIASLQLMRTEIGSGFYLGCALLFGGGQATLAFYGLTTDAGSRWARWFFFYTLLYLPAVFLALVIGRLGHA